VQLGKEMSHNQGVTVCRELPTAENSRSNNNSDILRENNLGSKFHFWIFEKRELVLSLSLYIYIYFFFFVCVRLRD
jgi:hypothetical protein